MALPNAILSASFSLGAVFVWGTSDFVGGYAAKRANAFVVTLIAHTSGMLLMVAMAVGTHAPRLSHHAWGWAIAAGLAGGATLAIFYRALAAGNMGLTAPVAAVLGAAIPTAFGMITEGFPGAAPIAGFVLAVLGIKVSASPCWRESVLRDSICAPARREMNPRCGFRRSRRAPRRY